MQNTRGEKTAIEFMLISADHDLHMTTGRTLSMAKRRTVVAVVL
jgi:hypothetical protein